MKKRLLFIIWSFSHGGGAERVLANVVNNLDPDKYDIEILEFYYAGIKKENLNPNIILHKPIVDVTNKRFFNLLKNKIICFLTFFFCGGLIRRIYLNKTYDVEISFNYLTSTFLLSKKSGKRIAWIHGVVDDLKTKRVYRFLQKRSFKKADKIVAISKKCLESIKSVFPESSNKLELIYNGYDFNHILKMAKEKENTEIDIVFCARLDENKNPIRMLKILQLINEKGYDFKLGIIGVGELFDEVKKYVDDNNLSNHVSLLGYCDNPYKYMNKAKIICMTSYSEGFPTVIIEGMTLGKPFVTTSVSGVDEMYDNKNCGFIEDDNASYADRVIELLTNKKMYAKMSSHCQEYVKKFSLEKQISALESMINDTKKGNK